MERIDPDATLEALRHALSPYGGPIDGITAAELFEALDNWLTRGGFLPSDWER